MSLNLQMAAALAELPLRCLCREYPNKLDHVMSGPEDVLSPRALHPTFYGCFDWHSAVHGHWMLVALLKRFDLPRSERIRAMIHETMSRPNIEREAAYLDQLGRESFERPYGWAWLLKLALELHGWQDRDGAVWANNLKPLEERITQRFLDFLPRQTYPVRSGLHSNTAFGLTFPLDYAANTDHPTLKRLLIERALTYYGDDAEFSVESEPGGSDFLSPVLVEADLMRRVLPPGAFAPWFRRLLPDPTHILEPAKVSDRSDPQIGHLDGLNLSRAWCMRGIGKALPPGSETRRLLERSAEVHTQTGLAHIETGDYAGEHWLASFAVHLLTA